MRKAIFGLVACALALVIAFGAEYFSAEETYRYHQHLEAPEKETCSHTGGELCTHLPLLQIDTNGVPIPGANIYDADGLRIGYTTTESGEEELLCDVKVADSREKNNHLTDPASLQSKARIRIRGNSSRAFDKTGYRLTLVTGAGENNPQEMMGMAAHHEWVLHGPFLDKSLVRNYLCYNIAGEMMGYAPNVRFCEVVLNGEYQGLYLMVESITGGQDGARLNIKVNRKDNAYTGYILRLDRGSQTPVKNITPFSAYSLRMQNGKFNVVYPGTSNLSDQMAENIRQDFSDFEHMLYSYDFDDPECGYSQVVDVDSFVDYFIFNEFCSNYDACIYSTYVYKDISGKYRMCVWDFNNAFDNYQEQAIDPHTFLLQDSLWFNAMIKDEAFTERLISRYAQLRETFLNEAYLNHYIDQTIAYLGTAVDRNFEKWGYAFEKEDDMLYPTDRNLHSFDEAVAQLKGYIAQRGSWMDENIDVLRQYSADAKSKTAKEHTR
ncbi:MAG: CotH kinase family protein [Oscillospiraceae bacterium]|nr:CotH kinase family protein [Oscillospiraceae bacterium]